MLENKSILRFTIPLLHYCNLKCSYCHVPNEEHAYLDYDIFTKGVDFFYESPGAYKNLVLYGGEPLLLKDEQLDRMISYAVEKKSKYSEKRIDITLVTNLTIYRKSLEPILEKLDNLCVSIDGQKQAHDVNRGLFDVTYKNFKEILKNEKIKKGATINKVVNKNNVTTFFDDIIYLLDEFGLPITYNAALSVEDWDEASVEILEKQTADIFQYACREKILKKLENFFKIPMRCCPFGTLSMGLDGLIFNCEFIANDKINKPNPVFDLKKNELVKQDIKSCFYNITSSRCESEMCLDCGLTCTKFSFQNNVKLSENASQLVQRVKNARQIHGKYFRDIVEKKYNHHLDLQVEFHGFNDIFTLFNCLYSLCAILGFKSFRLVSNMSSDKNQAIHKLLTILLAKSKAKFDLIIVEDGVGVCSDMLLKAHNGNFYAFGEYLGNTNSEMTSFLQD